MILTTEQEWTEVFAERLKTLMKNHNISNTQLAEKAGIGKNSVINYRTGKHLPNLYAAANIAKILNISLDDLAGFEHIDIFEAAGFDEKQSKKLRKICRTCNVEPDVLIRIVRAMEK